ncbi:uncharacterized protein I303_102473 [Kwoniella dejecticola CBS 10117]|uniref:Autophagy-related protein 14 n=1 Tax=Kwoniella dejecticola CBS 10117 TaxID=1296121 RepID=A0AAJ8ME08_9TREE
MPSEPPRCSCCRLRQSPLYCASCLQQGINLHNAALKNIQAQIDILTPRVASLVSDVPKQPGTARNLNRWRHLRSEVAERKGRCDQLRITIQIRERDIAQSKSSRPQQELIRTGKIRQAADDSARRRSNLRALRFGPSAEVELRSAIEKCQSQQNTTAYHIVNARRVLVQEAIAVFGLTKNTMGEWTIAGIVLPGPDAFRPSVASKLKPRKSLSASRVLAQPNISAVIVKSMRKHRQFLTAFALLAFSVSYLAWSQGVQGIGIREGEEYRDDSDEENPRPVSRAQATNPDAVLISATSVIELMQCLATSPDLGRTTHEPGTDRVLRHLGFGLDVAQVVQNVLDTEENRWGTRASAESAEELSEGWDLLDADGT